MKKRTKRQLKKLCLKEWAKRIRARDRKCQWCSSTNRLQAHHIVAKSLVNFYGLTDLINGMLLCQRCHFYRSRDESRDFNKFLDAWLWKKDLTYDYLRDLYRPIVKLCAEDYEYKLEQLSGKHI